MSVKNVVKVMNFHSLLRVNEARKKIEQAHAYENELSSSILDIINNRIFKEEKVSIKLPTNAKELNIYIGSDLGFCASFNSDVINFIKSDEAKNDKIIVGKKINIETKNKIMYLDKEEFVKNDDKIYDIVLDGVLNNRYSKINIIYIHYYNLNRQEVTKKTILPVSFLENRDETKRTKDDDFSIEGDLRFIIWSLISIYVTTEIGIAEKLSWASENVKRQTFTSESLKKIEELEEEKARIERKAKKKKSFEKIIEANNKKITEKNREE